MDEPHLLPHLKEIRNLFRIIRQLQSQGVSIIYISHRLEEIMEIGSRVTVMRDGCFVGTRDVATLQLQELITMMVGRKIEDVYNRTYLEPGIERLRTTKVTGSLPMSICVLVEVVWSSPGWSVLAGPRL